MALAPGTHVGRYVILNPLGAGGMGEVYRARDPRLNRDVAIKVLPSALATDAERLRRFEQEAHAAAALNHPNILAVYDVGVLHRDGRSGTPGVAQTGSPSSYLVSELLEGHTLEQRLHRGPLGIRTAIEYARELAIGLAAAHEKGIVHRDLKPANVFVTRDDRVKILDFGLAKLTESESGGADGQAPTATLPGQLLGTVPYMSPEQVRGQTADHRSDIFAVGLILFEMLSGERAFQGDTTADVISAILERDPPELPMIERRVPRSIVRIVTRCLEKAPSSRFQTANDLAFVLDNLLNTSASGIDGAEVRAPAKRFQRTWALAAVTLLLAALTLASVLYVRRPPPDEAVTQAVIMPPADVGVFATAPPFALSPDGRLLALVATGGSGDRMIWIRPIAEQIAEPLAGTSGAEAPFWSPDSRSVAFIADGTLKRIDVSGGPPVAVARMPRPFPGTWNRDNVILFTGQDGALSRVSLASGVVSAATTLDRHTDERHSFPYFLPDGRRFLYVSESARGASRLYAGALDSSERHLVLEGVSNAQYALRTLMFVREATLMAQPFDPQRATLSGQATPIADQIQLSTLSLTAGTSRAGAFSMSDAGVLVYLRSPSASSQLVWFDRQGKRVGVLGDQASYGDVFLSRNSPHASVSIDTAGVGTRDIWTYDLIRGFRTRLTSDPGNEFEGVRSPDGTRIVFNSSRNGVLDLYEKAVDDPGPGKLVLGDKLAKYPQGWSPDGRSLLYLAAGDVWLLPFIGNRKPYPIVADSRFAEGGGAKFSPDGNWISYASDETGRAEVYLEPFPNRGKRVQVSTNGGVEAKWGKDSRELHYFEPGPSNRLMTVTLTIDGASVTVGAARPIVAIRPAGPRSFYDVTPDGQRFLVNSLLDQSGTVPINIVVNWPARLNSAR